MKTKTEDRLDFRVFLQNRAGGTCRRRVNWNYAEGRGAAIQNEGEKYCSAVENVTQHSGGSLCVL